MVSLIGRDSRTQECWVAYLKRGRPRFSYTPLHDLEVENALRLQSHLAPAGKPEEMTRIIECRKES